MSEAAIRELARTRLGFGRLRPGQLRAVAAASEGRDVLAVLPTGGGKSAIYELAGLLRDGPTVVVSPLIALQDDQLAHLRAAGLSAIVLNSQQSARARTAALVASCDSDTFVFVSPEQLTNTETREALRRARPGLFVVDEAHLVSQWGHDFRTDYMRLGAQADALAAPVRMALTATAALPVREEITRRLGLREPEVVIGNFDRPHIELSARGVHSVEEKHRELERAASEFDGAGIVYAATHASAETARDVLSSAGHRVTLYHAGLSARERHEAMTAFLDGSARIVAATVAFGMGIDKPDVRWVLHADPTASLDAYYQELGRAGRDEKDAHARLLFRPEEQARVRVLLVAAGASQLLVVRIERRRRVRMEHPADVWLVDSHPERHSRRDDSRRAVEEGRHRLVPLSCRKPGVVERHPVPGSREHIPRRLRTSVGRRVHDPRAVELRCRALELSMLLLDRADAPGR